MDTARTSRAGSSRAPFANAPVYVVALALAAIVLVPIGYVVLSGFRTTGQLAADPVGLPDPWVRHNYVERSLTSGAFWRQLGNSMIVAAIATWLVVTVSAHGRVSALAHAVPRPRGDLHVLHVRAALPDRRRRAASLPPPAPARPARVAARRRARRRLRSAIPITIIILRPFMRADPGRARGRGRDGRLRAGSGSSCASSCRSRSPRS